MRADGAPVAEVILLLLKAGANPRQKVEGIMGMFGAKNLIILHA